MKKKLALVLSLFFVLAGACVFAVRVSGRESAGFCRYRFAEKKEGTGLLLSNTAYYNGFTQNDLDYRMQKTSASLDEYLDFAAAQVESFSADEKQAVETIMREIAETYREKKYHLPACGDIIFIKTTMAEECGAGGYTHQNQIYLGDAVVKCAVSENDYDRLYAKYLVVHEIFHCLTRSSPQFRKNMYAVLGFTVLDEDIPLSAEIRGKYISNPDVEHHNSYAVFSINGQDIPCTAILITERPFEKPGDSFFETMNTGLVPVDNPSVLYTKEDASNFYDVFGRNTDYVIDPEETLADNFAYAFVFGRFGVTYETPHIVDAIVALLQSPE